QHAPALRQLWLEYGAARRSGGSNVSEREVLRAGTRVGAWPPAAGARRDQLHEPELRSAAGDRADGAAERRSGAFTRHLGQGFSRAHGEYAGGNHREWLQEGVLHLRSDSDLKSSRRDMGDGV